jgi:phosphonate transport system substrate-binding protein
MDRPMRFDRRSFLAAGVTAAGLALAIRVGAKTHEGLVLVYNPRENPEKLRGDIEVISSYLSKEMDVPVRGFVARDHAAALAALRNGDADVAFLGALSYLIANAEIGAEVVLSEVYRGKPTYTCRIFVRRDSGIDTLADLRGKAIAFADPTSESGYLYPLDVFVEQGLLKRGDDPKAFFGKVFFAGGYQQAIQAMASGLVDAAGVSEYAERLLTPEQLAEVKWIAESKPVPSYVVVARKGLNPLLREKFAAAMLKLNEPDYRGLLQHVYNPDGYVKGDPAAFDGLKQLAKANGLLK